MTTTTNMTTTEFWADVLIAASIATPADALVEASAPALWQASAGLRQSEETFRLGLMLGLQTLLDSPDALHAMVQRLCDDLGVEVVANLY